MVIVEIYRCACCGMVAVSHPDDRCARCSSCRPGIGRACALLESRDRELIEGALPGGRQAPSPALLLSMAQKMETFEDSKVRRDRDPQTGRLKLSYSTEKGFVGDVALPPSFLINVPVFQDGEPQPLEVRVRPEVDKGGAAKFTVTIHAGADVLRDAFAVLCARVGQETGLPVFHGTPEQQ